MVFAIAFVVVFVLFFCGFLVVLMSNWWLLISVFRADYIWGLSGDGGGGGCVRGGGGLKNGSDSFRH